MKKLSVVVGALLGFVVVLAACGGDDDDGVVAGGETGGTGADDTGGGKTENGGTGNTPNGGAGADVTGGGGSGADVTGGGGSGADVTGGGGSGGDVTGGGGSGGDVTGGGGSGGGGTPTSWTCSAEYGYGAGDGCDCGCGDWDPDCVPGALVFGCDSEDYPNYTCVNQAGRGVCQVGAPWGSPPDSWTCSQSWYAAHDGCDCECGAWDPDCGTEKEGPVFHCGYGFAQCVPGAGGGVCVRPPIPADWDPTCQDTDGSFFNDGWCDCTCGAWDIDCNIRSEMRYPLDCADGDICVKDTDGNPMCQPLVIPNNWDCPEWYYLDDDCDCDCGAWDIDCDDPVLAANSSSCGYGEICVKTVGDLPICQ